MTGRRGAAKVRCVDVDDVLPDAVDGAPLAERVQRHVDGCLRCQAELARYRRLRRALRALRTEVLDPSPGLVADVLAGLGGCAARRPPPARPGAAPGSLRAARLVGAGAVAAGAAALAVRVLAERRSGRS